MKKITLTEIDSYIIITNIEDPTPDPQETSNKVNALILKNPNILQIKTKDELLNENIVPALLNANQKYIDDAEAKRLQNIRINLKPHEKLLLTGDIVVDWRNTEYWTKKAEIWSKNKIKKFGKSLPPDAILFEELTKIQQQEIINQMEAERIAVLSYEQRAEEKEAALIALKQTVRHLKEEAEIADEPFDAKAEYQLRNAEIQEKYK